VVLFLFNAIETNVLRESSTSEFSHSLDPERTSQGLDLFRKMLSISRGAGGMGHERSEQQVDRRANLRLFLAAFVQSASKLNTDFQSGSPNEATIEPRATIFGEKQGEVIR
jgi:hypothetical protein